MIAQTKARLWPSVWILAVVGVGAFLQACDHDAPDGKDEVEKAPQVVLDPAFGDQGVVLIDAGETTRKPTLRRAVVTDSRGRIVVAGEFDLVIWRYETVAR